MSYWLIITVLLLYCVLLYGWSRYISRGAVATTFFTADRKAPWPLVAYGMVGASISGVTFISVPGNVLTENFYYIPMVIGFILGYLFIAKVLLPLYYREGDVTIYALLEKRLGRQSRMSAAVFFFISRLLNCAVRIFIVALVLSSILDVGSEWGRFVSIVLVFLSLLFLYTYKGGVKTLVLTDIFHTSLVLLALVAAIISVVSNLQGDNSDVILQQILSSDYLSVIDNRWDSPTNCLKQVVAGFFMTVAMTGLDQGMMQKNLSCKTLSQSQKNVYTTSVIILIVNLLFLALGALFGLYIENVGGISALGVASTDEIFPWVATNLMGKGGLLLFLLGLISSSYPSSAASVTSLTTSLYHDILTLHKRKGLSEKKLYHIRVTLQLVIVIVIMLIVILFYHFNNTSVINLIYKLASYTYGPLLGLFAFSFWGKFSVKEGFVPYITICSVLLSLIVDQLLKHFIGFDIGFSLLILNGVITFAGMLLFRKEDLN